MLETMNDILSRTWQHLYGGITYFLPPLLVAVLIIALAWICAHIARFAVARLVKGRAADRFLRSTGFSTLVRPQGELHTGPLVARAVFWTVFLGGVLAALSVFQAHWMQRFVETTMLLLPKVVTAGIILLAGLWLSVYLSRSMVLWASEEGLPAPRRWASAVRVVVMFTAVVVASDVLDFAPGVFFAAFVILVGGAALGSAIALGLGGQDAVRRWVSGDARSGGEVSEEDEASLWRHL